MHSVLDDKKVNESFIYQSFKSWLELNSHRFSLTPFIADVEDESFKVQFLEAGNIISLIVNSKGEFSIWTSLVEGRYFLKTWDWVFDFDIVEKKNENGYYSMLEFNSDSFTYYKTREELYENLCYEPFLNWCNENLKPGHYIINGRSKEGVGYSKICSQMDLASIDKSEIIDFVKIATEPCKCL